MRLAMVALFAGACGAKQAPVASGGGTPAPSSPGWYCHTVHANDSDYARAECGHACPEVASDMHATSDCTPQAIVYCYSIHDDDGGEGDGHDEDVCTPDAASCNARASQEGDYLAGETTVTAPCAPMR